MAISKIAGMGGDALEQTTDRVSKKIKKNELLSAHGEAGWLVVQLRRYSILGWLLFLFTFLVLLGGMFLYMLLPKPVQVVNEAGVYVGDIDFVDEAMRSDNEILVGGMNFLTHYLSMNSETIVHDYTITLNTMTKALRTQSLEAEKKDGYIAEVQKARSRSNILFDQKENPPQILERKGLNVAARFKGILTVYPLSGTPTDSPFDITLFINSVPRTSLKIRGFEIAAINDN